MVGIPDGSVTSVEETRVDGIGRLELISVEEPSAVKVPTGDSRTELLNSRAIEEDIVEESEGERTGVNTADVVVDSEFDSAAPLYCTVETSLEEGMMIWDDDTTVDEGVPFTILLEETSSIEANCDDDWRIVVDVESIISLDVCERETLVTTDGILDEELSYIEIELEVNVDGPQHL